MANHQLVTEIEIAASAEQVWQVLTDLATYPDWKPFIRSVSGQPVTGERLRIL